MQEKSEVMRCPTCYSAVQPEETKCGGCGIELPKTVQKEDTISEEVTAKNGGAKPFRGKVGRPVGTGKNWVKK